MPFVDEAFEEVGTQGFAPASEPPLPGTDTNTNSARQTIGRLIAYFTYLFPAFLLPTLKQQFLQQVFTPLTRNSFAKLTRFLTKPPSSMESTDTESDHFRPSTSARDERQLVLASPTRPRADGAAPALEPTRTEASDTTKDGGKPQRAGGNMKGTLYEIYPHAMAFNSFTCNGGDPRQSHITFRVGVPPNRSGPCSTLGELLFAVAVIVFLGWVIFTACRAWSQGCLL